MVSHSGSRGGPEPRLCGASEDAVEELSTPLAPTRRRRLPAVAVVYGWAVAASLAAVAPFAAVYTLVVQLPNGVVRRASMDGWGRDHPDQTLQFNGHGVRFGIALWVCVLGLIAAAVLCVLVVRARRPADAAVLGRRAAIAAIAAIAAPCLLAGVVGTLVLSAQSYVDGIDAISADRQAGLTAGEAVYQAGYGAAVWLSLAALVVALLSSYVFLRRLLSEPLGDRAGLDAVGP